MESVVQPAVVEADSAPAQASATLSPSIRRVVKILWRLGLILLVLIVLFPIRFDSLRVLEVGVLIFLWAGALAFQWSRRGVRTALACVGLAGVLTLALPGRPDDPAEFRKAYVAALHRYEGTTYVWGGETRLGVDCSGLTRAAYVDTCYRRGVTTLNPQLIRDGLSMWYHDRSAKALGEGYRGESRALFEAPGINSLDHRRLLPGDLAVTGGGVHVMAYGGNNEWIEADPKEMRVIRARAPDRRIAWFDMHVSVVRWSRLCE